MQGHRGSDCLVGSHIQHLPNALRSCPLTWPFLPTLLARRSNSVMTLLRTLANEGTSICATIHSPSAYAFKLFDSVMMMLRGEVVYFGPAGETCCTGP